MSEELHNTSPPAAQSPPSPAPQQQQDNWFVDGFKKQIVAVAFAAVWAFYTFVWNSHDSQKDLKYKIEANTKTIEKLVIADKEQSEAMNQFMIALTKVSEAQNRLAGDVKDIQTAQQRNTEMLLNRK